MKKERKKKTEQKQTNKKKQHKKPKWVRRHNIGERSKIISEVTVRQWVLFLQPLLQHGIFTTRLSKLLERKLTESYSGKMHNFLPSKTDLAQCLDAANVQRFLLVTEVTWPSLREKLRVLRFFFVVAWIKLTVSHCQQGLLMWIQLQILYC